MATAAGCFAKPGTREHAEHIVRMATGGAHSTVLVAALEALGLLKLEEPPTLYSVQLSRSDGSVTNDCGLIREDRLIETLRMAGYEVTKR